MSGVDEESTGRREAAQEEGRARDGHEVKCYSNKMLGVFNPPVRGRVTPGSNGSEPRSETYMVFVQMEWWSPRMSQTVGPVGITYISVQAPARAVGRRQWALSCLSR